MPNTVKRELIDLPKQFVQPEQPEPPLQFQMVCKQPLRTQPGLLT